MFILHFTKCTNPLVNLTCKGVPFEFGPEQTVAQEDLKKVLLTSPALQPIDYSSNLHVILVVDMSIIMVGFYLCQADPDNPRKHFYAHFGSITLNDRERRFSQPKLELYWLFRMLYVYKIFLVSIRNLIVKVDTRYI